MELLILLLLGGAVVLIVQLNSLGTRVRKLELILERTRPWEPAAESEPEPQPESEPRAVDPGDAFAWPEAPVPEPKPERVIELHGERDGIIEEEAARSETLGGLFERFVAGKLLIWVGGIALFVAAVLLIRFSIERGLLTPGARMIGAGIFGLVLLAGAEVLRVRFADDQRFAQALSGAGIATLYATFYGSHMLYGLIGPGTASTAMVAVTGVALVLSLRHGAPTAVMGLIGGFLTPLLVGDPNAGAVRLLAYLALLDLAIFAIAWRRGWTWLAAAGVLLSFVWSGFLLTRPLPEDALVAGLFVVLLGIAASLVRPGEGKQLSLIQPLAIAAVQVAVLVARTDLGLQAWLLYGALSLASLALAVLRPAFRFAPPAALGLALLLLMGKAASFVDPWVEEAAIGVTLLFGAGGIALAVRRDRPLWTMVAIFGLAGPLLILRFVRPELLQLWAWGALAALLTLGPALLVWLNRERASEESPADLVLSFAGAAAALLAGVAVWDLAMTDLIAAGWLLIALGVALAARRLGDLALATVSALAALAAIGWAVWMMIYLLGAAVAGLAGQPIYASWLPSARDAFFALALPAVLLAALRFVMPPLPLGTRRALPAIAGTFAVAALYVWFKQLFGLAEGDDFVARGLLERTIITQALFATGWLLGAGIVKVPRVDDATLKGWGTALTLIATARLIWFEMILFNPADNQQWVGTLPVLNLILPAFLLSAAWLYAARRRAEAGTRSGFWLVAFLAALIVGVALLVRQGFQGPILFGGETPIAEFYGYSLAGLGLAIGLIVAGMRLPDKALRLAGLILLTATILKVFLVDASELEGLLRILSFLGLGIALIGIGRLYGPVLRAESE